MSHHYISGCLYGGWSWNGIDEARQQLESMIRAEYPRYRYAWERTYKPEAERLLSELGMSPVK